jgi:hypothetical protein
MRHAALTVRYEYPGGGAESPAGVTGEFRSGAGASVKDTIASANGAIAFANGAIAYAKDTIAFANGAIASANGAIASGNVAIASVFGADAHEKAVIARAMRAR